MVFWTVMLCSLVENYQNVYETSQKTIFLSCLFFWVGGGGGGAAGTWH
jgi:hypothetical protein